MPNPAMTSPAEIARLVMRQVEAWAREQSATHHRLAHENKFLRAEHVASSAAYRDVADELAARADELQKGMSDD